MAEVNELTIKLKVDDAEIRNLEFKIQVDDSTLTEFENNAKQTLRNLEKEFATLGATSKSTFSNLNSVNSKQIKRAEPKVPMSIAGVVPIAELEGYGLGGFLVDAH